MKSLLFTAGLLAGFSICLYWNSLRVLDYRTLYKSEFRSRCRWQMVAEGINIKLRECMNYDQHCRMMIDEIKQTGRIHTPSNQCSVITIIK